MKENINKESPVRHSQFPLYLGEPPLTAPLTAPFTVLFTTCAASLVEEASALELAHAAAAAAEAAAAAAAAAHTLHSAIIRKDTYL